MFNVNVLSRVWETGTWSCEKWTGMAGRCQAACWSPDASVLLLANEKEPFIYSLTFAKGSDGMDAVNGGSRPAVLCADLSETIISDSNEETKSVGGLIHDMVWDSTGQRLAIIFQGDEEEGVIAVFRTKVSPAVELSPCGFIVGDSKESPLHISFQPIFSEGAMLCVVWSSGRIGYVPLYFNYQKTDGQERFVRQLPGNGVSNHTQSFSRLETLE